MMLSGVEIGDDEIIWDPKELEENIFVILGTLKRELKFKIESEPFKKEDGRWAIKIRRR